MSEPIDKESRALIASIGAVGFFVWFLFLFYGGLSEDHPVRDFFRYTLGAVFAAGIYGWLPFAAWPYVRDAVHGEYTAVEILIVIVMTIIGLTIFFLVTLFPNCASNIFAQLYGCP